MILLMILIIWEALAWTEAISTLFFPAPSTILRTLIDSLLSGEMLSDLGSSLFRLSLGLLLGGGLGLMLGLLMGWSRVVRTVAEPFIAAIHPIPKVALLPLILILVGIGEQARVTLIALAAFFPMLINSMAGVRQIDPLYWDVAANYGARGRALLTRVLLPGSLPLIMVGFRLAVNSAFVITIVMELVMGKKGLGARIWLAWETLRTEELFATLVVIAGLGIAFNWLIKRLTVILVPWQTLE